MTKIALIGAAGQIGTPLSLLCKTVSLNILKGVQQQLKVWLADRGTLKSDLFDEISLYDLVHAPGIATDLNHIDTRAVVSGYLAEGDGLKKALQGADFIVVTAGIARKPGMSRDGTCAPVKANIMVSLEANVAL